MTIKARVEKVSELLKRDFPEVLTPLLHRNVFELLMSTILSPQTLDDTTNKVTGNLFDKYPDIEALSNANPSDIEKIIRIVNYHKTKSRNLVAAAQMLKNDFNSQVPSKLSDLIKLPGVGRKVGNVVIAEWFAKPLEKRGTPTLPKFEIDKMQDWEKEFVLPEGFVIDTHVLRTSQRLGLTKNKTPEKVEQDLMKLFPRNEWNDMSLRLIFHGRFRCKARNPECINDEEWGKICGCVQEHN